MVAFSDLRANILQYSVQFENLNPAAFSGNATPSFSSKFTSSFGPVSLATMMGETNAFVAELQKLDAVKAGIMMSGMCNYWFEAVVDTSVPNLL
jgi:hypothetical protein